MLRTRFSPSAQPPDFGGRYQGLVAVVTGASSGLGAQLSVDLARAGATVYGLARNTERLDKLATDLRTFTPASGTITCDVADTAALRRALDDVAAAHGRSDLLVNNAAQDPGVRNWLDTSGYPSGAIQGRWFDASSAPTPVSYCACVKSRAF